MEYNGEDFLNSLESIDGLELPEKFDLDKLRISPILNGQLKSKQKHKIH